MEDKSVKALLALAFVAAAGMFVKGAWANARAQAEEAANPRVRWTDANRWEK
jgi:hypothetical protein